MKTADFVSEFFLTRTSFFSFKDVYEKNFGTSFGTENFCMIHGSHEIAKNANQVKAAFESFKKYGDESGDVMARQSSYCFGSWENGV